MTRAKDFARLALLTALIPASAIELSAQQASCTTRPCPLRLEPVREWSLIAGAGRHRLLSQAGDTVIAAIGAAGFETNSITWASPLARDSVLLYRRLARRTVAIEAISVGLLVTGAALFIQEPGLKGSRGAIQGGTLLSGAILAGVARYTGMHARQLLQGSVDEHNLALSR